MLSGQEVSAGSSADAQQIMKQKLEEYKRRKDLERLKEKISRQRDHTPARGFIVTAPKKDLLSDFIPSIIHSECVFVNTPTPAASTAAAQQTHSGIKSRMLSATSTAAVQTDSLHSSDAWSLRSQFSDFMNAAKLNLNSMSVDERVFIETCSSAFDRLKAASKQSKLSNQSSTVLWSINTFPLPTRAPSHPLLHSLNFAIANDHEPHEEEDEPPVKILTQFETPEDDDDDEVVFNTTHQRPAVDEEEDLESSMDVTPPKSRYLDELMNEEPEISPTGSPGIQWKDDEGPDSNQADNRLMMITMIPLPKRNHILNHLRQSPVKMEPHIPIKSRGTLKSTSAACELANMLSNIDLNSGTSATPVKNERKVRDGKELRVGFSNVKKDPVSHHNPVEVQIGPKTCDGSVVVLTPRKASKKEKMDLGVDSVVTNARRSLRFMPVDLSSPTSSHLQESTASNKNETPEIKKEKSSSVFGPLSAFGPDARDRVNKLLQDHGNAFVPNKVLALPGSSTTTNTSTAPPTSHTQAIKKNTSSKPVTPASRIRQPSATKISPASNNVERVSDARVRSSPGSPFTVHSVVASGSSGRHTRSQTSDASQASTAIRIKDEADLTPRATRIR
ncbi:hypothetical protein BDR26DRAFT_877785 [Obelidium mucronatum]|nr:hypothetical protein BDR26DRAFT_877785 [Obelidium mucronatum]